MIADEKSLVTLWFEEVWNRRSSAAIDRMMTPSCLTKVEGLDEPLTRDQFKDYHRAFLNAVPDLRAEIIFVAADAGRVIASWRAKGTHSGPGLGIPPSGRPVDFTGLSVFEFAGDQIVAGLTGGTEVK